MHANPSDFYNYYFLEVHVYKFDSCLPELRLLAIWESINFKLPFEIAKSHYNKVNVKIETEK